MQKQLKSLKNEQAIMQDLHTNSMLREIFKHMKQSSNSTNKVKLMFEVQLKLSKIFKDARQMNPNLSKQTVYTHDSKLSEIINGYAALSSGKNFTSQLTRFKLLTLLREQQTDILDQGQYYSTEEKMFSTYFEKHDTATDDLTITIEN